MELRSLTFSIEAIFTILRGPKSYQYMMDNKQRWGRNKLCIAGFEPLAAEKEALASFAVPMKTLPSECIHQNTVKCVSFQAFVTFIKIHWYRVERY